MLKFKSFQIAVIIYCAIRAQTFVAAATIANLELIADGSANPPGDRLEFLPSLAPDETEAACEIRAFTVGNDRKHSQAVKARGKADRDANGVLVISRTIHRSEKPAAKLSVVVPYAEMDLPLGTHWLGYCVSVKCANREPFIVATRLTQVVISETPRSEMKVQERTVKESIQSQEQTALVGNPAAKKGTEAARQSITLSMPKVSSEIKTTDVKVNIPGGFQRYVPPLEISRGDESSYADRDGLAASTTALVSLSSLSTIPPAAAKSNDPRLVYFATNRARAKTSTPEQPAFSSEVGAEVLTGKCWVNIPVQHQRGNLEQPSFWTTADPKEHFMVDRTQLLPKEQVFKDATADDLLVYMHGFNTEFDFAVLRAAQLRYDLQFPGAAMAICWPSAGSMLAYPQDRQHAEQSFERVADVLQSMVQAARQTSGGQKPRKIQLLAHSLGNYVFLNAMYLLHSRGVFGENDHLFGQVVLAAPDVGALEFNNLLPFVIQHADRVTYYYCTRDAALSVSRQSNFYEPVGLMPFFQTGLDTINTDLVDTSFLYHGYYASARQVLNDVQLLVNKQCPPDERLPPLAPATLVLGHRHWAFAPVVATPVVNEVAAAK